MTIKRILLAASLLACLSCVAGRAETSTSNLEHINWALAHDDECLEVVFGAEDDYRDAANEGIVVVLDHLGPEDIEEQVVLTKRGDEPATARVTRMVGESLLNQMAAMHRRDTSITPEVACQRLQVESFEIKDEEWVDEAVTRLHDMSISPVLYAPLVIHGHIYEIRILTFLAESNFWFSGVSRQGETSSPLEDWSRWVLTHVNGTDGEDEAAPKKRDG